MEWLLHHLTRLPCLLKRRPVYRKYCVLDSEGDFQVTLVLTSKDNCLIVCVKSLLNLRFTFLLSKVHRVTVDFRSFSLWGSIPTLWSNVLRKRDVLIQNVQNEGVLKLFFAFWILPTGVRGEGGGEAT